MDKVKEKRAALEAMLTKFLHIEATQGEVMAAGDAYALAVLDEARFQDCGECAEEDYLALRTRIKELGDGQG